MFQRNSRIYARGNIAERLVLVNVINDPLDIGKALAIQTAKKCRCRRTRIGQILHAAIAIDARKPLAAC